MYQTALDLDMPTTATPPTETKTSTPAPNTLESLRLSRNWSQRLTSRKIGITNNTYRDWESGKYKPVSLVKLKRLATTFDISLDRAVQVLGIQPRESNLGLERVKAFSRSGVGGWLRGKNPSVASAVYLAQANGISLDELCKKLGI